METFGQAIHRLRGDTSLRQLADLANIHQAHLSRMAAGKRPPTMQAAIALDRALDTDGELAELVGAAQPEQHDAAEGRPWETAELLQRIQAGAITPATVEALRVTVFELCCEYPTREASGLRKEAHGWLRHVARQLRLPVGLDAHKELLTAAGWLALLTGCLEYDMGMRAGAEATRVAARQLGKDGGNAEIVGWSHEMAAWFALTQHRYRAVHEAAQAGQHAAPGGSAAVQLAGQEAKAYARLGNIGAVRDALDRGRAMLGAMPPPDRPDHHFVVDPDKWDFYAMDAYRLAGDDERAAHHAKNVLELGAGPEGDRAPMRMAEARLTLAAVAAREGDLEKAVTTGINALGGQRKSLPSLLMVARELDTELGRRYPAESETADFHEALHSINGAGQ
jgi:transcriptional regulator with XRE-family HTH domain